MGSVECTMSQIKIIIHTCNNRKWYVNEYLIPSLVKQNIKQQEIKVWCDDKHIGNLRAFVECMQWIGQNLDIGGAAWHLQDDVIVSKDFAKTIRKNYKGQIVCGFCCSKWDTYTSNKIGEQPTENLWFSFPCICIPNKYALEFVQWFQETGSRIHRFNNLLKANKGDDSFFREFIAYQHHRQKGFNLKPNIVEHIDWLIGGSQVNVDRKGDARAFYWEEEELVEELKKKLGV